MLRGIGRVHGSAPAKKQAATLDVVRDAVRALGKEDSLKALRDQAIMLIGFEAALQPPSRSSRYSRTARNVGSPPRAMASIGRWPLKRGPALGRLIHSTASDSSK